MRIANYKWFACVFFVIVAAVQCGSLMLAQDRTARPHRAPARVANSDVRATAAAAKSPQYLPYDDGQKWVEHDISAYTSQFPEEDSPQQDIVDWVLRETGTEVWFAEPLGFMNASRDKLRVYHVPQVQKQVKGIVERFTRAPSDKYVLGVRVMTVGSPNWRARALPLMRRVSVQAAGVDAWVMSKENAAQLIAQLRKRTDFAEHSTPNVVVSSGRNQTIERRMTRSYSRSIEWLEGSTPNYQIEKGALDEGYMLEISPLLSVDGRSIDAAIKCQIDQVEKFLPVQIDVPNATGQSQRVQVEVPQVSSWRLHERFRWPTDQVLILSCGVVASPQGERAAMGLPIPIGNSPARADALLVLDCRGKTTQPAAAPPRAATQSTSPPFTRGRY